MHKSGKYSGSLTEERCIVFDTIVQVKFFQIESITAVVFLEHTSSKVRHIGAEGRAEVVSCPDMVVKVDE
jgi:hypothetical protein